MAAGIIGIVAVVFIVGPWAGWYFLSDDDTLGDGDRLDIRNAWRLFIPTWTFAVAGTLWVIGAPWPALVTLALAAVMNVWLSWQALLAIWGRGIVYMLRCDYSRGPKRAGHTLYIGHTGRDWEARKAEHQDDRSLTWEEWKEAVDWSISGPAWRRLTKRGANRLEVRTIRTLTYAARQDYLPSIENKADTAIRGPVHPILSARFWWLRLQGAVLPSRAVHRRPAGAVEHPGPVEIDERTTPIEDMPLVVDAEEVASTTTARTSGPSARTASGTPAPASPAAADSSPTVDPPSDSDQSTEPASVSSSHDEASHQSAPSHVSPHPPVGGMSSDETTDSRDAESGDDETLEGEVRWADEEVEDTGLADEAADWLAQQERRGTGRGAGRRKGGSRSSSGGKVAAPAWLADARLLRDRGLSYDAIRSALEADGCKVSKATVARWLREA